MWFSTSHGSFVGTFPTRTSRKVRLWDSILLGHLGSYSSLSDLCRKNRTVPLLTPQVREGVNKVWVARSRRLFRYKFGTSRSVGRSPVTGHQGVQFRRISPVRKETQESDLNKCRVVKCRQRGRSPSPETHVSGTESGPSTSCLHRFLPSLLLSFLFFSLLLPSIDNLLSYL